MHFLPSKTRKSYTVIGALSPERRSLVSSVIESTNKKDVLKFLKYLRKDMKQPKKTLIVWDNHVSAIRAGIISEFGHFSYHLSAHF